MRISLFVLLFLFACVTASTVTVKTPIAGDRWAIASQQHISWTCSSDIEQKPIEITLCKESDCSDDQPTNLLVKPNASTLHGEWTWLVKQVTPDQYYIRIKIDQTEQMSPQFEIYDNHVIQVTSPAADAQWDVLSDRLIKWTSPAAWGDKGVKLMLVPHDGQPVIPLWSTGSGNPGQYHWHVPPMRPAPYRVQVEINSFTGLSSHFVIIRSLNQTLRVTSPTASEKVHAHKPVLVEWERPLEQLDKTATVNISLCPVDPKTHQIQGKCKLIQRDHRDTFDAAHPTGNFTWTAEGEASYNMILVASSLGTWGYGPVFRLLGASVGWVVAVGIVCGLLIISIMALAVVCWPKMHDRWLRRQQLRGYDVVPTDADDGHPGTINDDLQDAYVGPIGQETSRSYPSDPL